MLWLQLEEEHSRTSSGYLSLSARANAAAGLGEAVSESSLVGEKKRGM